MVAVGASVPDDALKSTQGGGEAFAMNDAEQILGNTVAWASAEPNVRGLVLVGSRAQNGLTDDLADIDVQVYARTAEPYTRDKFWLSVIGPVWVCVHDEYRHGDLVVPTRLVIFARGTKVDFAFYRAASMADVVRDATAYRVLLDKDNAATDVGHQAWRAEPRGEPSEAEFVRVVREFWFEAYHVAKYLARGELWLAKSRDWATKEFLRIMIEWHARAERGWSLDTQYGGKHMPSWVSRDVWEDLHRAFAHFDAEDSWDSLFATTELFRRVAVDTAAALGLLYPEDVDQNISGFVLKLRGSTNSQPE